MKKGILISIAVVINIVLVVIGFLNCEKFFEITLANILSLNVTVFISVILVQTLLSERRKNEFLVKLLNEISTDLQDERVFNHNDNLKASMLQKSIANRIMFVSDACQYTGKKSSTYIKEHFETLQTYYGDHNNTDVHDPFYEREKVNILDKIVKLQLELYDFKVGEQNDMC